jgi:hypothetical protein
VVLAAALSIGTPPAAATTGSPSACMSPSGCHCV